MAGDTSFLTHGALTILFWSAESLCPCALAKLPVRKRKLHRKICLNIAVNFKFLFLKIIIQIIPLPQLTQFEVFHLVILRHSPQWSVCVILQDTPKLGII